MIWYCNRRQIRQTNVYSIHSDRRMTRITINKVQLEHAGEYTVEVINSGGKTVSSGKLTVVEGKRKEEEEEEEQEKKQEKKKLKKEEEVQDVEMEDVSEEVGHCGLAWRILIDVGFRCFDYRLRRTLNLRSGNSP